MFAAHRQQTYSINRTSRKMTIEFLLLLFIKSLPVWLCNEVIWSWFVFGVDLGRSFASGWMSERSKQNKIASGIYLKCKVKWKPWISVWANAHCYMTEISKMCIMALEAWVHLWNSIYMYISSVVCTLYNQNETKWVIFGIERKRVPRQSYLFNMGITWSSA